jgi:hypothetical protein
MTHQETKLAAAVMLAAIHGQTEMLEALEEHRFHEEQWSQKVETLVRRLLASEVNATA